jgi:transcriptional regulator with XRE-family HTH domain
MDTRHKSAAEQIRYWRLARGLTQTELAEIAGTKQSRISALESAHYGKPSLTTLHRVADALGCTIEVRFTAK